MITVRKLCKKRHILLLEVLIAFAIIVLCIFPLIYPHAAMAKSQREFIKKIELDHAVSLLFGQIYQDLQRNKIEWNDIEGKRKFEITPDELRTLNHGKSLPYKGYYYFEEILHKPKRQIQTEATAYLFRLIFKFQPQYESKTKKSKKSAKNFEYKYKVFILHDLRVDKGSSKPGNEGKSDEKKSEE